MTSRQSTAPRQADGAPFGAWPIADLVAIEWPTLLLIVGATVGWAAALYLHEAIGVLPTILAAILCTVLHSSLQHESIHGHPTRSSRLNALLVLPALGVFVPYDRFRDLHTHHHRTGQLTDPVDDPESGYMTADDWRRLGPVPRALLRFNNTLLGRMTIGPALALVRFYADEWQRRGDPRIVRAWLVHLLALAPVLAWVWYCGMNPLIYLAAVAYPTYGILMLRTFAEHQAHADEDMRTAIVEDRGPLAWLFLFNNLHVVHHRRPDLPWYRLSRAYWRNRSLWTGANGGYVYPSYRALIARHLLRAKEPVVHPSAGAHPTDA